MERPEEYENPEEVEGEEYEEEDGHVIEESDPEAPEEAEDGEEESEAPEEEEPQKKRTGRLPANQRIHELTKSHYQTQAELQRLREENEQLRQFGIRAEQDYRIADKAALASWEESAKLKLERAKIKKQVARENGDIQGEIDADVEMAEAASTIQNIGPMKSARAREEQALEQQAQYQNQYAQHYQQQVQQYQETVARDKQIASHNWLKENWDWASPQSKNYDPDLWAEAKAAGDQLEQYYASIGRPELVLTSEYWSNVNAHLDSLSEQNMKRPLKMSQPRNQVAPVRSHNQQRRTTSYNGRDVLNSYDRDIIKSWGLNEEKFAKRKLKDMQDNPQWYYGPQR